MGEQHAVATEQLSRLSTPSGGFAMVALDQRESLREMFPTDPSGDLVDDQVLVEFKERTAQILTPFATGVLLDKDYGVLKAARPSFLADNCGLILAADVLHSRRGVGVVSTSLDPLIDKSFIEGTGAAAIKLLIMWRRGADPATADLLARFLDLASSSGVASFVEGIVRPAIGEEWIDVADRHDAILEAAAELSPGASVYKAEVPGYIPGDLGSVRASAAALSAIVDGPWVVLSNGMQQVDFSSAVRESCAGGAHGFLAGRAIWADTVAEDDYAAAITGRSIGRLMDLREIVEESRRPR